MIAFGAFLLTFFAGVAVLAFHGDTVGVRYAVGDAAAFAVLSLLTWLLTRSAEVGALEEKERPRAPWLQVACCVAIVILTGVLAAIEQGALARHTATVRHVSRLASVGFPELLRYGGAQFLVYVGLTALMLLPFRIKPRYLGLSWGIGTLSVGFVWLSAPLILIAIDVIHGAYAWPFLVANLCRNFFSNGFSEEFLMRGALMSRLANVCPPSWALFFQAAIFGAWHYGANMHGANGNVAIAVASMAAHQMLFGYAMGFVTLRTRSIAVPSLFHMLFDSRPF
jgi:membrane protease YdiL (CAAX protease family)